MHPPSKWHNSGSSYELQWTDTDLLEKHIAHFKCGEELGWCWCLCFPCMIRHFLRVKPANNISYHTFTLNRRAVSSAILWNTKASALPTQQLTQTDKHSNYVWQFGRCFCFLFFCNVVWNYTCIKLRCSSEYANFYFTRRLVRPFDVPISSKRCTSFSTEKRWNTPLDI